MQLKVLNYVNYNKYYYKIGIDFRGRIYILNDNLNYQNNKLVRYMILIPEISEIIDTDGYFNLLCILIYNEYYNDNLIVDMNIHNIDLQNKIISTMNEFYLTYLKRTHISPKFLLKFKNPVYALSLLLEIQNLYLYIENNNLYKNRLKLKLNTLK